MGSQELLHWPHKSRPKAGLAPGPGSYLAEGEAAQLGRTAPPTAAPVVRGMCQHHPQVMDFWTKYLRTMTADRT